MKNLLANFGFEFGNVSILKEPVKFQILPKNKIQKD